MVVPVAGELTSGHAPARIGAYGIKKRLALQAPRLRCLGIRLRALLSSFVDHFRNCPFVLGSGPIPKLPIQHGHLQRQGFNFPIAGAILAEELAGHENVRFVSFFFDIDSDDEVKLIDADGA
jgi:hypothetical protein